MYTERLVSLTFRVISPFYVTSTKDISNDFNAPEVNSAIMTA